jgi:phage portal protein BeeE
MSWLTPVVREVMGDLAYTRHKLSFIDNAATPNLAVTLKETVTPEQFEEFVDQMDAAHKGPTKSGKTLYLGGGADVTVVGADMAQLDFKAVQGAGESRIAAAAGVGATIAQFSEGMQGSALNSGNYGSTKRRFGDVTMRHLWQEAAGAFAAIIDVPGGSQLWYDAADISFLQEDAKDAAEIEQIKAATIANLVKEGFTADSAKAAVMGADMTLLEHTGLVSVQLQPPGTLEPEPEAAPSPNGSAPAVQPVAAN